jgi:hypothetical protein
MVLWQSAQGDSELSHVSPRFLGARGAYCSAIAYSMMYISSTWLRNISLLSLTSWLKSYSYFLKMFNCLIIIKLRSIKGSMPINFSSSDSISFNMNLRSKHANRCCEYGHSVCMQMLNWLPRIITIATFFLTYFTLNRKGVGGHNFWMLHSIWPFVFAMTLADRYIDIYVIYYQAIMNTTRARTKSFAWYPGQTLALVLVPAWTNMRVKFRFFPYHLLGYLDTMWNS